MSLRLAQLCCGPNASSRPRSEIQSCGSSSSAPALIDARKATSRRFSSCTQAYLDRGFGHMLRAEPRSAHMQTPALLTNPRYCGSSSAMLSGQRVFKSTPRCKLTSVPPSLAGTAMTEPFSPEIPSAVASVCDDTVSSAPSTSSTAHNPITTNSTLSTHTSSSPASVTRPGPAAETHDASPPLPYTLPAPQAPLPTSSQATTSHTLQASVQPASQASVQSSQASIPTPNSNSSSRSTSSSNNLQHSTPPPAPPPPTPPPSPSFTSSSPSFQIQPLHILLFSLIFVGGAIFATMTIQFTADVQFNVALQTVARRVGKSMAFRQLCIISSAILVVRFGLNNLFHMLARFAPNAVPWEKTKLYYVLREVYQPLELLLFIAAICTLAESFVPQLIAIPKPTVAHFVKSTMSVSFLMATANVIFNLKSRWCKENAWQGEMKGDQTGQRRWEAYDKLGSFIIFSMTFVLGVQAIGLEVTSVLAIGGIGGLAIGLAGREICENLLNGLIIMTTNPFEVGDEVHFFHTSKNVEGIVIDIGWYRTLIRSFEREVYVIPNAVFSKNIVLNISRKNKEWRFHENLSIRVQDVDKCQAIVQDIRRVVRNDARVMNKLHRRIFMDKVTQEDVKIYISFYADAPNREAFMTIKQDLLLAFIDCVERQGARLATPRTIVDMDPELMRSMASLGPILNAAAVNMAKAASDARSSSNGNVSSNSASFTSVLAISDGSTFTTDTTLSPRPSPSSNFSSVSTSSSSGGGNWDRLPIQGSGSSSVGAGVAASASGSVLPKPPVEDSYGSAYTGVSNNVVGAPLGGAAVPVARPLATPLRSAGSAAVLERSEDPTHPFVQAMNTALKNMASAVFEP